MKIFRVFAILAVALTMTTASIAWGAAPGGATPRLRVLVVTGGHDFEQEPFFQMFKDNPEITWKSAEHPNAHPLLRLEAAREFDVLVTYDLHHEITDQAKSDLLAWLKAGKGLVVLHHAIASYKDWPEYNKIISARYYLGPVVVDGVSKKASAYQHGVDFKVKIANPNHPVTRGLKDFDIKDETYKFFDLYEKDITPLLTTDEPLSNPVIGWAKTYETARVVYIQLGHDHWAYENVNYRKLVKQAIEWVARRS